MKCPLDKKITYKRVTYRGGDELPAELAKILKPAKKKTVKKVNKEAKDGNFSKHK